MLSSKFFSIAMTFLHLILRYLINLNVNIIYRDYRSDRSRSETPQWGKATVYFSTEFTHSLLLIVAYFLWLRFYPLWTVLFIYLLCIVSTLCYGLFLVSYFLFTLPTRLPLFLFLFLLNFIPPSFSFAFYSLRCT